MKSSLNRIQPVFYVDQLDNMESKGLLFLFIAALLAPSWVSPSPVPDDDGRVRHEGDEYDDSPSDGDDMDRESSDQNDQSDNYSNRGNDDRDDYNTKSNDDDDDYSNRRFDDNDDYSRGKEDNDDFSDRRNDDRDDDWGDDGHDNDWGAKRRGKGNYGDDYGNRMEDNGENFHDDDQDEWKTKKRGKNGEEERNNDDEDNDRVRNRVKGSQSRFTSGGMSIINADYARILICVVIYQAQNTIPII